MTAEIEHKLLAINSCWVRNNWLDWINVCLHTYRTVTQSDKLQTLLIRTLLLNLAMCIGTNHWCSWCQRRIDWWLFLRFSDLFFPKKKTAMSYKVEIPWWRLKLLPYQRLKFLKEGWNSFSTVGWNSYQYQ